MDLSVEYLGLKLAHPVLPGASPLADEAGDGPGAGGRRRPGHHPALAVRGATHAGATVHVHGHRAVPGLLVGGHEHACPSRQTTGWAPTLTWSSIRKIRAAVKVPVIASLNGTTLGGWLDFARLIEDAGAYALELNLYAVPTDPARDGAAVERDTLDLVADPEGEGRRSRSR